MRDDLSLNAGRQRTLAWEDPVALADRVGEMVGVFSQTSPSSSRALSVSWPAGRSRDRSDSSAAGQAVPMRLRDGTTVSVRPVGPEDKSLIQGGFERLSPESRYRRFLSPAPKLNDRMLAYLTEVDHHDHEALLALDLVTREGIGVARFVRMKSDPESAEVAVTVVDDWQGRGLGTVLLSALGRRAREEGVTRFTGVALAENRNVLGLLAKLGPTRVFAHGPGTVELAVDLTAERVAPRLIDVRRRRRCRGSPTRPHTKITPRSPRTVKAHLTVRRPASPPA
jgi:GNAT superfamily N-acetyltransferase